MKEVIHARSLRNKVDELKFSTASRLTQKRESIRILYWVLGIVGSGVVAGITIYLAILR
ncbi:hypothetical protein SAMN05444420_1102 [Capnocytophaga granulosa]|uniref:Uncharacterized protein n=1 Tax=Capnocytophaga granulosa TaxID=45242 RepID=A0A1H2ZFK3_9FLAO|nr:hypothetical protein [Capnocytophaga granulosa]EPD27160.1 hypothetical protein HMPREF9331_02355 [Capnocytophaga granulosa ATCC 51502]SDX15574.1 hypothetical protein SAMN05444420_1102 [Capnocytophaga granulosa]SUX18945.1 Uncharacterised protein [Capnocytophaga granulosa]